MINGTGTLSYRKKDLENQKVTAIGFTKMKFAHKASAGATGINLSALTTPTEMTSNGFSNPTASQLAASQILFFRNNLKMTSSSGRVMEDFGSYVVASSTQINFVGFTALEGEIFVGVIDYSAQTGLKVVDATAQPSTGTLAAAATDFNVGTPYQTNKYSTTQIGAVAVYLDGILQVRNTANSSTILDGNYREVDNGGGSFTVIRFNLADPDNIRNVVIVPNGLLSERPDGSMMAVIESAQGQINSVASYVAALAGLTTTTVLGSAPTNVDLKAFGDRVLTLEQNRARTDITNTFLAYQTIPGRTDGSSVPTGYIGETVISTQITNTVLSTGVTEVTNASVSLGVGIWMIYFSIDIQVTTTAVSGERTIANLEIQTNAGGTVTGSGSRVIVKATSAVAADMNSRCTNCVPVVVTTPTIYKLRGSRTDIVTGPGTAQALVGNGSSFFAIRIG